MTKHRARKHAARERAAVTGERYVVAQRAVSPPVPAPRGLHGITHRIPGVPSHVDGGLQGTGMPNPTHRNENREHGRPRVLVGWQNWIAQLLGARS